MQELKTRLQYMETARMMQLSHKTKTNEKLSLHVALHSIAKAENYPNWQTLSGMLFKENLKKYENYTDMDLQEEWINHYIEYSEIREKHKMMKKIMEKRGLIT